MRVTQKISVLGLGHIGLPTALLLASAGYEVVGVDVKSEVVDALKRGHIPFAEPGLKELLERAKENFRAQTGVEESDVFIIAVPTPFNKERGMADLRFVLKAAEMVYPHLKKGNLVILESTVPPGTSERVVIPMLERSGLRAGDFLFAHCPERAMPGRTLEEMTMNDRVIGGFDEKSATAAKDLYLSFVRGKSSPQASEPRSS